jgi:hypothetical protein
MCEVMSGTIPICTSPNGRPTTLFPEQEQLVLQGCREFENIYGLITKSVLRNEALHLALLPSDDEERSDDALWEKSACNRAQRVGGRRWFNSFLKRHPDVTISKNRQPVEKKRASKTQPEIAVQHFRNLSHEYAMTQIQLVISGGVSVPEWVLPLSEGMVTREGALGCDPGYDILELRSVLGVEKIYIIPLNVELEILKPSLVVAIDEKPLIPDSPSQQRMSILGVRHAVGCS